MAKTEIGSPGLAEFSGQIQADFLREWRGKEAYKRANEMRLNSPIVGALLLSVEYSIRKVDWFFSSDQGHDDPRLALLNEAREAMSLSWNDHIAEAVTFLPFGFSIFEIVYQVVGGQWLWKKFAPRGQDTVRAWKFDENGGLAGFVQSAAPKYTEVEISIEDLIIYRTRVERGNPEGRSILRTAWIPYYFAKHMQQTEAIGIERGLDGFPVVKLPVDATTDESDANSDASKAAKIVRNIRNDEQAGIVLPFGWELDLMAPGSQSRLDADKVIRRYESRILMSTLSQFLMLGQEAVGSYALSSDQTSFFAMSMNAVADIVSETFTKYAIPRLLKLNGYDAQGLRLEHTPAGDVDLTKITDLLSRAGANITWRPEDEMWLREVGGMPKIEQEEIEEAAEEKAERAEELAERLAQMNEARGNQADPDGMFRGERKVTIVTDPSGPQRHTIFAANPPDEVARRKMERKLNRQLTSFQDELRKKILKAGKQFRSGSHLDNT
jgi:hypothetical protein